ncbi:MAG: PepSY domain-containing protein, partial [Comamonadaceae bacterium]|nr:PepSY domain-containing protein [Comamonadaceae bacterium]
MPHAKRWLFLAHRWLGVLLCAFFAMWFVSGVVMMYVGYPKLTPAERLRHLPPLPATGLLEPAQALRAAGLDGPLQALRLAAASGARAVYLATPAHGPARTVVIDAATGERLARAGAARALASALAFQAQMPPGAAMLEPPQYLGEIGEDAFTHSRALDAHRPLHKLQLHDAAATVLYVSSQTGEVVRDAPRRERAWNYLGAWIHWLYPLRGGVLDAWWAGIVDSLALLGIALALTGTVAGVWRWRFAGRYRSGARTPYPGAVMRWHHVAGLLFALSTSTWIFSGLMSMNPWKIFDSGAPALRTTALHGGQLQLAEGAARVQALLQAPGPGL